MRTRVTRTIALITDTVATDAYAGGLIYGALAAAAERGYLLFVCETEEDPELESQLLGELADRHVDAYLYASLFTREVTLPSELGSERVVLLNCRAADSGCPAVVPDEREAGRDAACALLDAGHRERIWLVGEPDQLVIAVGNAPLGSTRPWSAPGSPSPARSPAPGGRSPPTSSSAPCWTAVPNPPRSSA